MRRWILISLLAVLLTGCTVHPVPYAATPQGIADHLCQQVARFAGEITARRDAGMPMERLFTMVYHAGDTGMLRQVIVTVYAWPQASAPQLEEHVRLACYSTPMAALRRGVLWNL